MEASSPGHLQIIISSLLSCCRGPLGRLPSEPMLHLTGLVNVFDSVLARNFYVPTITYSSGGGLEVSQYRGQTAGWW